MNITKSVASTLISMVALTSPGIAEQKNIVDTAVGAGSFKTLATALDAAGLVGALQGDGPFTVFAPTDAAFAKIPKKTLASLLEPKNRDQLTAILTYHVVEGSVDAAAAVSARSAPSLQKEKLRFAIREGQLNVNDAKVTANDILCSNGVIHVIDTVLMPPSTKGRPVIGVNVENVSRALAAQLGVERGKALLISSVTAKGNAKKAGVKNYDVLTAVNGRPATSNSIDVAKKEVGIDGDIMLDVIRGGKPLKLTVTVGFETH